MAADHSHRPSRRRFLQLSAAGCLVINSDHVGGAGQKPAPEGLVTGQREAAAAGARVLASGGNAVDTAVAAAFVAGIASPSNCGVGGYGGHMVIGWPGGRVTAIDFNSTAPAAAREDMFSRDEQGASAEPSISTAGWLRASPVRWPACNSPSTSSAQGGSGNWSSPQSNSPAMA